MPARTFVTFSPDGRWLALSGADYQLLEVGSWQPKNPPRPMLLIARKHPDTCQSFVAGRAEVVYTFEELGLDPAQPFTLANPVMGDPSP